MIAEFDQDPTSLSSTARAHAERSEWGELYALLDARRDELGNSTWALMLRAEAAWWLGRPAETFRVLEDGRSLLVRSGGGAPLRKALNMLGAAALELGDLDAAERSFSEALDLASADQDELVMARAVNNLAIVATLRGKHEDALGLYQLSVPVYQRLGSATGLAQSFHNLGTTFRFMRQLDRADECEQRAIEHARDANDHRLLAMARTGRAELSLLRGDAELAVAGAQIAAQECAAIPDPAGEADALRLTGAAKTALQHFDEALVALDRALLLAREHGSALIEAEARRSRAELWLAMRRLDRARDDARAAESLFQKLGSESELATVRAILAEVEGREPDEG